MSMFLLFDLLMKDQKMDQEKDQKMDQKSRRSILRFKVLNCGYMKEQEK